MRIDLQSDTRGAPPVTAFAATDMLAKPPGGGENPSANALRRPALTLWGEGKPGTAAELLRAACELAPGDAAIWGDLAGALNAASRPDEARLAIERSLAIDCSQPRGWLLLATICGALADDGGTERAYLKALDIDPLLADAAFGLGILLFRNNRFEAAAEQFRAVTLIGTANKFVYVCLGKALHLIGEFAKAARAYEAAADMGSAEPDLIRNLALLCLVETAISSTADEAFEVYRRVAGEHGDDIAKVAGTAFHQLNGYGHREAAIRLGQARLALVPDDPVQRYLLAALSGAPVARAPQDYLVAYFDRFAEGFDRQLVEKLGYDVPRGLKALVASIQPSYRAVLDLGCGTGLASPHLRPITGVLMGVDISPAMLAKATARKFYDGLAEADVVAFLGSGDDQFDMIFAADLLVYFGDLRPLFVAAAKRLERGGLFAFSIETSRRQAGYELLPTGRFAHAQAYIDGVSGDLFEGIATHDAQLRLEANLPVEGAFVVLKRRRRPPLRVRGAVPGRSSRRP